jgi:hypothetical protein
MNGAQLDFPMTLPWSQISEIRFERYLPHCLLVTANFLREITLIFGDVSAVLLS